MDLKLKKLAAPLIALLLVFSLTGCIGNLYENAGTVDGTEISSGLYLMAQYNAYNEAKNEEGIDSEKDLFKQKIDGVKASKWIESRTDELLRRYVAVRTLSRERDIEMDATGQENLQQMQQYWTYLEPTYAENGIAYTSFERYLTTDELSRQLFQQLYAKDGELAVPDDELKKEYGEKYAHIRAYSVPLNSLEEGVEVADQVLALLEKMPAMLSGGMSMETLLQKEMPAVYKITGRDFDPASAAGSIYSNYIAYEPDNYDTYSETFLAQLKEQKVGDFGYYNMGSTAIVYEKTVTFADDDAFQQERETVLTRLKNEDYEDYLKSIYETYEVEWLPFVSTYFRPTKIKAL